MRQCPDCEEKDRVVIAGKVFCANCGAPWQTADKAEEEKYLQKVGLGTAPAPAPDKTAATMSTEPDDPVKVALAAAGGSVAEGAPAAPAIPVPTPLTPTPTAAPTAPQPPAPAAPTTPPITPTPASSPAAVTVPMGVPVSSPPTAPAPAKATPVSSPDEAKPATPPPPIAPTPEPTAAPDTTPEPPKEEVASEIPTLDSKEDPILTDSQFKELANVTAPATSSPPSTSTPTPTRPMNDVVAPTQVVQPSASVAAAAAAMKASPAPASQTASPSMTTVAGVTMSREDALKLALGDEVGADVAKPNDKAEKKGPARPTAVVMSVIALILLGAYLWQVNYPNFALRLAAMRAGVSAASPGYVPIGWSEAREVKTSSGSLSYTLTKGDKKLTVTETKTNWDSQAVLEQYVLKNSNDYLALQAQGLTIYVYGDNQAAWVNHGSFYSLTGDHGIDQDDMIRMATSL